MERGSRDLAEPLGRFYGSKPGFVSSDCSAAALACAVALQAASSSYWPVPSVGRPIAQCRGKQASELVGRLPTGAPRLVVLVMEGCEACERAVDALTRRGVPFVVVNRCSEATGPPCFADTAVDTAYPAFLVLDETGRVERISAGWPSGATADEAVEYYRRCTE